MEVAPDAWQCESCFFLNEGDEIMECTMCETPREEVPICEDPPAVDEPPRPDDWRALYVQTPHAGGTARDDGLSAEPVLDGPVDAWQCGSCFAVNAGAGMLECAVCDTPREEAPVRDDPPTWFEHPLYQRYWDHLARVKDWFVDHLRKAPKGGDGISAAVQQRRQYHEQWLAALNSPEENDQPAPIEQPRMPQAFPSDESHQQQLSQLMSHHGCNDVTQLLAFLMTQLSTRLARQASQGGYAMQEQVTQAISGVSPLLMQSLAQNQISQVQPLMNGRNTASQQPLRGGNHTFQAAASVLQQAAASQLQLRGNYSQQARVGMQQSQAHVGNTHHQQSRNNSQMLQGNNNPALLQSLNASQHASAQFQAPQSVGGGQSMGGGQSLGGGKSATQRRNKNKRKSRGNSALGAPPGDGGRGNSALGAPPGGGGQQQMQGPSRANGAAASQAGGGSGAMPGQGPRAMPGEGPRANPAGEGLSKNAVRRRRWREKRQEQRREARAGNKPVLSSMFEMAMEITPDMRQFFQKSAQHRKDREGSTSRTEGGGSTAPPAHPPVRSLAYC